MSNAVGGCLIPTTHGFYLLPTKLSSGNFQNHIKTYLTPPSITFDFITYKNLQSLSMVNCDEMNMSCP